jgi:hypothetical protein
MLKEAVWAYLNLLSRHSSRKFEYNCGNSQSNQFGFQLQDAALEIYRSVWVLLFRIQNFGEEKC